MKHLLTYSNNIEVFRGKAREIESAHAELITDELENILLLIPKITVYNTDENGAIHSVSLLSYIDPYKGGKLFGLMKAFENELDVLAVGDQRDIFDEVFANPSKAAKYDLAFPLSYEQDENGIDTAILKPRFAFGQFDLRV